MKQKQKPTKKLKPRKSVERIVCPKCGELMLKIFPWASFKLPTGEPVPMCIRCRNLDDRKNKVVRVRSKLG